MKSTIFIKSKFITILFRKCMPHNGIEIKTNPIPIPDSKPSIILETASSNILLI